jgi:hypothetical protein
MDIIKSSPDGNAWAIMGYVRRLFKEAGRMDEWPEVQKRMTSGDYDNLCQVAEEVTHGSIRVVDCEEEE